MNEPNIEDMDEGAPKRGPWAETLHTWRYLAWLLCLLLVVVLWYAEENWRGRRAWEKFKLEMEAQGIPLDRSRIIPPRVPDSENFAMTPLLAPLATFRPRSQQGAPNVLLGMQSFAQRYDQAAGLLYSRDEIRSNSWVRGRTDLALWESAFAAGPKSRPSADLVPTNHDPSTAAAAVLEGLSEAGPALAELQQASRRRFARFNIQYDTDNPSSILLPHLAAERHLSQILQLRASAFLARNQTDDAFQDVELMLYLVNVSREEPFLISHLVRLGVFQAALQSIAEGTSQWSDPQLRALQDRVAAFDFLADRRRMLLGEWVFCGSGFIEYVRKSHRRFEVMSELGAPNDGLSANLRMADMLMSIAPNGWFDFEKINYGRRFQTNLSEKAEVGRHPAEAAGSPAEGETSAVGTAVSPFGLVLRHEFFAQLLLPSLEGLSRKTAFHQTAADTATIACALERYRRAKGQLPDTLEKLVPEWIARIPHDRISGQPLIYQVASPDRYLLYSIGWNEKDDGGTVKPAKKTGEGSDAHEGDWVWRPL